MRCEPCDKNTYPTYLIAVRMALRCSYRAGRPLRIYPCPEGNGYHLTKRTTPITEREAS